MDLLLLVVVILWCTVTIRSDSGDGENYSAAIDQYRCGVKMRDDLNEILNDSLPDQGQWPWFVALIHGGEYCCGGTLIDEQYVLSLATCVYSCNPTFALLRIKTLDKSRQEDSINSSISNTFLHPKFNSKFGLFYNIAILKLSKPVRYSEFIFPICIEGIQKDRLRNLAGRMVGIGYEESSKMMMKIPSWYLKNISLEMFCLNYVGTRIFSEYDNMMYIFVGDHWKLRGISSTASDVDSICFTDVAYHYEWIMNTMYGTEWLVIPRRISELKCHQYSKFARKDTDNNCYNTHTPHTVAVIDGNQQHISSGSIISEKFVLTKAPNLIDALAVDRLLQYFFISIFVSEIDWNNLRIKQPYTKVIQKIFHEEFDPETFRHDIMLLELESPLTFTSHFLPACLANMATEYLHVSHILSGYTATTFYKSAKNQIIPYDQCIANMKQFHRKYNVYSENICTTVSHEEPFLWNGIKGGALQMLDKNTCMFMQLGVLKDLIPYEKNQKDMKRMFVYSRVTSYLDWIEKHVWGNESASGEVDMDDDIY